MRKIYLLIFINMCLYISNDLSGQLQPWERNYEFGDGIITKNTLESYLSRAITQGEFCLPSSDVLFEENVRMLKNIGAKFIGRSAFEWTPSMDNEAHFAKVTKYAKKAHETDSTWILQACIFEAIYKSTKNQFFPFGVDLIPVPTWVFEEFGLTPETRNFNYEAMLFPNGNHATRWSNGGAAPDITQLETQLYFYYRAVRYIDAGFEAIHWGQVLLMGENDTPSYSNWFSLLERVRMYAKANARNGIVLCDAHAGKGIISTDNHLLLDFHGYPQRPIEICDKPYECELVLGRGILGQSIGGITPSGWECESLPYIIEFDNSGADDVHDCTHPTWYWPWGWDEITWFAHCSNDYRNEYLKYAFNWLAENDPVGYLEMPGNVTIAPDPILIEGTNDKIWNYTLNNPSASARLGFGQEDVVKELWDINKLNVHKGETIEAHSLSSIFSLHFKNNKISINKMDGSVLEYAYNNVDYFDFILESTQKKTPGDTTTIFDHNMNGIVKVYPNPVSHILNIECSQLNDSEVFLKIYDIRGTLLYQERFMNESVHALDISHLNNGIYLLQLNGRDLNKTLKILKK